MRPRARTTMLALLERETPTVPFDDEATGATIWLKLEHLLPSGSTKDRFVARVLREGLASGQLRCDGVVVEASSGSTSIAFAMACALIGVRFRAVMPDGVSGERVLLIRRYGGEVELTDAALGLAGSLARTQELAAEDPLVFLPEQFTNPLNVAAHRQVTGPQLVAQVGGHLDGFVAGVGTAGTLMGVGWALRDAGLADAVLARAVPEHGVCFEGEPEVCGGIPGVVDGVSGLFDRTSLGLADDLLVPDAEAVRTARELCARGFAVGPSSGLNVAAARRLAAVLGPGSQVATVCCDRAERYFSTDLFADIAAKVAAPLG